MTFPSGEGTVPVNLAFGVTGERVVGGAIDELSADLAKFDRAMSQRFTRLNGKLIDTRTGVKATKQALDEWSDSTKTLDQLSGGIQKVSNNAEILKQKFQEIGKQRQQFRQLSFAASRASSIFRGIFLAGTAVSGGIFAAAAKYVKDAQVATKVTNEWKLAQDSLARSGRRFGAVAAEQALPALKTAARLASEAARFIEKNPEIVRAALNTGLVVASLGALGLAVTKGIKLIADVGYIYTTGQQLIAARMMKQAADEQVAAAGLMSKSGLTKAAGVGATGGLATVGRTLGNITLIASAVIIGVEAGKAIGNALGRLVYGKNYKTQSLADVGFTAARIPLLPLVAYAKLLDSLGGKYGKNSQSIRELITYLDQFSASLFGVKSSISSGAKKGVSGTVTDFIGGTDLEVAKAFSEFRQQAIESEEKYKQDRLRIIRDSNTALTTAYRNDSIAVQKINEAADRKIADLKKDYLKSDIEAEQKYAEQRTKIVQDSNDAIKRSQEDLKEKLRQLEIEHNQRMEDLVIARDALGIIQENRRYAQEREEATRQSNIEIARKKQETAQRLQELAQEQAQERAQRRADFEAKIKEAEAQREIDLKEQSDQFSAELRQLREAKARELKELDQAYRQEQLRNRENFLNKIRDLDASLLGEQGLRRKYYAQMLIDAENWLRQYRATLQGGSTNTTSQTTSTGVVITGTAGRIPTRQAGGYVPGGLTLLHPNEFILSPRTTRAAEQAIGGQLTQQRLINALAGLNRNITVNDSRRFSGDYTSAMRRAIQSDTISLFDNILE